MRSTTSAVALLLAAAASAGCGGGDGGDDGPRGGGTPLVALPGSIHTVAGTGEPGFGGDGFAARESSLFWPDDAAVAPDGRLCILDWNNHRVRLRSPDGTLVTAMGTGLPGDTDGLAGEALLNHPTGAAWDPEGRLVVACWHNHRVKRLREDGIVETLAGTGTPGFSGDGGPATAAALRLPTSVAFLPDGSLLLLDSGNQRLRRIGTDGVITTVAGKGTKGSSGDGGPAADAEFAFPDDPVGQPGGKVAVDRDGRVLLADAGNHRVRRIGTDGVIETVAGTGVPGLSGDGGPAVLAQLRAPSDVEAGRDGSIFVADRDNHRVRRIAPDGTIETFAGGHEDPGAPHEHGPFDGDGGPAATAPLRQPTGICLDRRGNLYVVDKGTHTVRVVVARRPGRLMLPPRPPGGDPDPDPGLAPTLGVPGTIDTLVGTGRTAFSGDGRGGLKTDLYWPIAVAVRSGTGELLLADWNNHRVRMVRSDGYVITVAGNGFPGDGVGHSEDVSLFHPTGLAVVPGSGDLLIASWHGQKVKRHSFVEDAMVDAAGSGVEGFSGDGGPAVAAALDLPSSVAADAAGRAFVADEANSRVRRVDADGTIGTFAGTGTPGDSGDGGPATAAALGFAGDASGRPANFLAVDAAGRLFIADSANHRVRRVDTDGTITTVAGNGTAGSSGDGGPATAATLRTPVGVAVDGDGTLYVADRDSHVVRRVDPGGTITTVAGTGAPGFSGDGGPAAAARLQEPHGLALDAGGNLYVADLGNGRVRVVWGARDLYARSVFPLFRKTCATSGCHTGPAAQHSLAFDDPDAAFASMVNAPSRERPAWLRVVPGDPANSYLYQKLDPTVPVDGDRMPAGKLPLTDRELAVVRAWIQQGAPR